MRGKATQNRKGMYLLSNLKKGSLGRCERHALLYMSPKWFDHWTTWTDEMNA